MWTRSGRPGAGVVVGDGDAVTDGRALGKLEAEAELKISRPLHAAVSPSSGVRASSRTWRCRSLRREAVTRDTSEAPGAPCAAAMARRGGRAEGTASNCASDGEKRRRLIAPADSRV